MIKKYLYTFETTLKKNIFFNDRCLNEDLNNNQRINNLPNTVRDINNDHFETENFDKYFNTIFIKNKFVIYNLLDDEDDDDF